MARGGLVPLWRQLRALRTEAVTVGQVEEMIQQALDERLGPKPAMPETGKK